MKKGSKHLPETVRRLSDIAKARPPMSAATRAIIGAQSKGRNVGPKSEEHKAKIRAARALQVITDETKAKMRAAWARRKAEGRTPTAEHKAKIAAAHLGMAKPPKLARRIWYKNICFRSTYEVRYAQALDAIGIEWVYEPERFHLGDCTYLPDFYLPDLDQWHEVKGWLDDESKKRIDAFQQQNPDKDLVLIMESELKDAEHHASS